MGEVGAVGSSVHRCRQHVPGPMLEARAARSTAAGPGGEIGHDAVVWTWDQAGLLQRRARGEEIAYSVRDGRAV